MPQLHGGVVYPISEDDVKEVPFEPPDTWPRYFGMDVGWNWNAVVWLATNPADGVHHLYALYKKGQAEPVVHADAIRTRGAWIPGAIDPAANIPNQKDGQRLLPIYRNLLYGNENSEQLAKADNTVEAGILEVWLLLSRGKLKVSNHLAEFFSEYRRYRRDDKGKIVKGDDHLLDALRYAVMTSREKATLPPRKTDAELRPEELVYETGPGGAFTAGLGWMGM